jgi:hypothetical protein
MLSESLLANLKELVASLNISYQFFMKEENFESINIETLIDILYEVSNSNQLTKIEIFNKKIQQLIEGIESEDNILQTSLYTKSIVYSYFYLTISICDRIINEKDLITYIEVKNLLIKVKEFLFKFINVVVES